MYHTLRKRALRQGKRIRMNKKTNSRLLITVLIVLAVVFTLVTILTARSAYQKRLAEEKLTELDFYSMQKYCGENAEELMEALESGSKEKLEELMPGAPGADELLAFTDWSKADFKNARSMGAGSLSDAPDENGRMDISERFIVEAGDTKYILFVETVTSRWGRNNEGISAAAATTYEHFEETGYEWNGTADDQSVLAGKSFLNK